ncbi:MAG: RnfABCDGE type electron transport complex subunit D [Bacillus subtilis]|nr:RnfABCDGE type electron transport complex subunit D [Bacillus subtilis]
MARFAAGKAPFLRVTDDRSKGTGIIMRDFMIGLIPIVLFAWYKNGIQVFLDGNVTFLEMLYPLVFILLGGVISATLEALFFVITDPTIKTPKALGMKMSTSYGLIPGFLLALMLPLYTPIWVLLFGCFMATIVTKMIFGGFGHNLFNPALLGYIAIGFTMTSVITAAGGVFNQSELLIDAYAGATPLSLLARLKEFDYDALVAPYGSLWNFFLGTIPGALGETSALAILIAYAWMAFRKVLKWYTPVIYVATVFLLSWILGALVGAEGLWFPIYSIFSGGLMFGAVLMATEPVTTPRNPFGKVLFALFLGVLTVLFRFVGNFPEGVGTAIIVMNIFTLPLDKFSAVVRAEGFKKAALIKTIGLLLFVVLIAVYAVLKANTLYTAFVVGGLF